MKTNQMKIAAGCWSDLRGKQGKAVNEVMRLLAQKQYTIIKQSYNDDAFEVQCKQLDLIKIVIQILSQDDLAQDKAFWELKHAYLDYIERRRLWLIKFWGEETARKLFPNAFKEVTSQ